MAVDEHHDDDELSRTFAALADRTRRGILARLAEGDATVNDLVAPFDLSQQAISKHLRVLEQAGLVSRTRLAQTRPCHLEPEPLTRAISWIERHRQIWDDRLDRLDAHLAALRGISRTEQTP